jgi:hypothetical protein
VGLEPAAWLYREITLWLCIFSRGAKIRRVRSYLGWKPGFIVSRFCSQAIVLL